MITVSISAQKYFLSLLSKEPKDTQIRVFVTHPGTSHAECGVSYCLKEEITTSDIQLKYNNFYIYVQKLLMPYLKDAKIDLMIDNLGSQLTLLAPYSKTNIFRKKDSLEGDVSNFLDIHINPHLSAHRGHVHLIKITTEKIAIVKFSGGCNGCSMSSVTLKEMIEKKLLSYFPQLKKICDVTDHTRGDHSFF